MKLSRRWFLKGAGATLAIPALPSLLAAREAEAQVAAQPTFFVNLGTHHGASWEQNFFPAAGAGAEKMTYAGFEIRRAPLAAAVNGTSAALSPVLSGAASSLTPSLVGKMNVLRGLDVPFYLGHHTGGHLGNFARNDGNGTDGMVAQTNAKRRTIDQIMAWSPAFYSDLASVRERVIIGSDRTSYNFTNPAAKTGDIQEIVSTFSTPHELFNTLFPSTAAPRRPLIVDRVVENYRRLRSSPRISAGDRARLDQHLERVYELQRRLGTVASCGAPALPAAPYLDTPYGYVIYNPPWVGNPAQQAAWLRVINDLVVAAFSCGLSRIAVGLMNVVLSTYSGDWHQDVAHQADQPDGVRQAVLNDSYRAFFADVVLDLVKKLDAVALPNGKTLLDQSLVVWSQEHGQHTHDVRDVPLVTFGSAGGAMRTGSYCDYRNVAVRFDNTETRLIQHPGLLWHQWLGSVLQLFGIPKAEWENPTVNGGYPDYNFANVDWVSLNAGQAYPASTWSAASEVLPWLRA